MDVTIRKRGNYTCDIVNIECKEAMGQYIADNGTVITDDMVEKWAAEAEGGFSGADVTPFEGRAWETHTEALNPRV
jgi:hypothetical protein